MPSDWAPTCLRLSPTASMNESWWFFFYSEFLWWHNLLQWYDGAICDCWSLWRWTTLYFPHLSMGNEGNKMLTLPLLDTLLPANNFKRDLAISVFLPVLHLQLSEDCPACPLHWGVQSPALSWKWACRTPFHATVMWGQQWSVAHFYCLWIACQQFLDSYKKGRKSAGVNLFLIKIYNLALKVGVAVGFRQAAGLVLPI